uniref:GDSL esterase/lipase EXL3 n=1 Tax=Kalanchoe fedtschenkoi TaxID=63787 RepID=A0A7N0R806_KALFE
MESRFPSCRLVWFVCSGLLFWCARVQSAFHIPKNLKISGLIVFGDSIVDPGNNNDVHTPSKANYPPYGQDFLGGVPTGRFCNGMVPSDYIAQALSIKELLPAYLDPNLQPADLLTGVSFASGGCGYDPLSSVFGVARTLAQQLDQFREYKTKLNSLVGENATTHIISQSLFLVVASSNDIASTYFASGARTGQYDIQSYTAFIANSAGDFVTELYDMGARLIGLFSAPPLGCLPSQRTLAGGIERKCVERYNQAAIMFNSKLSSVIDTFSDKYADAQAVVIDIYNPLMELIQNPVSNGFTVADKGCCGTGELEVTLLCSQKLNPLIRPCSDATKYIFWDSFHPTQAAYQLLVSRVYADYF